jgi:hypothetical protein
MRTSQRDPKGQARPAAWRRWLFLASTAAILTLLALPHGGQTGMVLSYSRFLAAVGAGAVRAVAIDPAAR